MQNQSKMTTQSNPVRSQVQKFGLSSVAWLPGKDLSLHDWSKEGLLFGRMGRASQWWIGDWVRYGEATYGARYTQASEITEYDVQSLMNMVYVASRYEISRRREKLSWSHHAEVAAKDVEEQERVLDWCEKRRASVQDLRWELRRIKRVGSDNDKDNGLVSVGDVGKSIDEVSATGEYQRCPQCGYELISA